MRNGEFRELAAFREALVILSLELNSQDKLGILRILAYLAERASRQCPTVGG